MRFDSRFSHQGYLGVNNPHDHLGLQQSVGQLRVLQQHVPRLLRTVLHAQLEREIRNRLHENPHLGREKKKTLLVVFATTYNSESCPHPKLLHQHNTLNRRRATISVVSGSQPKHSHGSAYGAVQLTRALVQQNTPPVGVKMSAAWRFFDFNEADCQMCKDKASLADRL